MTDFVTTEVVGGIGYLTLNRPQALNALSLDMIRAITHALTAWAEAPGVVAVVVAGAGGKAFCAGGDIRFFHRAALAKDPLLDQFFAEEYALNHQIHRYGKPYIALMDGVVMGGGMGISQGARRRIVTERTRWPCRKRISASFPTSVAAGSGAHAGPSRRIHGPDRRRPGRGGCALCRTGRPLPAVQCDG